MPPSADAVYSGVTSHLFGLDQVIEIGPMSGKSNVLFWLERHEHPADDALVNRIYRRRQQSSRVLTESEVQALCPRPRAIDPVTRVELRPELRL